MSKKYLVSIGGIILTLTILGFTQLQSNEDSFVCIRALEVYGSKSDSQIVITKGDDKPEIIQLESYSIKNIPSNTIAITKTLNRFKKDGYKIVSTAAMGTNQLSEITYILSK